MAIKLYLLSTPRVEIDGEFKNIKFNSPSSLLIYLAYRKKWVPRAELAFLYKPDEEEKEARRYVRLLIHRAKRLPWAKNLEVERQQVRFLVDSDVTDYLQVIAEKDWQKACDIYSESLLNGFSLPEIYSFNSWLELERNELEYNYQNALKENASNLEKQGGYLKASKNLIKLLEFDWANEEIVRLAMRNAYLGKDADLAIRIYDTFKKALKEELDLEPLKESQDLFTKIKNSEELEHSPIKEQSFTKLNLPIQTTRFIGRRNDLKNLNVRCASESCRLLSIVGLGGIGKTRLGLELARSQVANYPDGVFFIALADIKANMLASIIAKALELNIRSDAQTKTDLLKYLEDKKILLILDNFEHMLAAKEFVSEILNSSPKLTIVITTRVALNIKQEYIYDLRGLNYPLDENEENLANFDAIKLFISSANRVMPSLEFDADNLEIAAKITKLVEGMPLAIELASAWLRIISVEQLYLEVQKSLDMLSNQQNDALYRHRNVRAVFDYSWQRLAKKQQNILKQLAVFEGGFSLEAAEVVAGAHLNYLLNITNESLIRAVTSNRFSMHQLIRKYIREKLDEDETLDKEYKLKHAKYFVKMLSDCDIDRHEESKNSVDKIELEIENIRLSWQLLLNECQFKYLNNAIKVLDFFYKTRGLYQEAKIFYLSYIDGLRSKCDTNGLDYFELIANLHFRAGFCARQQDDLEQANELFNQALELGNLYEFKMVVVRCYFELGVIAYKKGEFLEAENYFLKTEEIGREIGDVKITVDAVNTLGLVAKATNKYDRARAYLTKAITLYNRLNNQRGEGIAFSNLGNLEESLGNYESAQKLYYKALPIFEELNYVPGIAVIKTNIGVIEYRLKNLAKSLEMTLAGLELKIKMQGSRGIAKSYINLARIYKDTSEEEKARKYLFDALDLANKNNFEPALIEAVSYLAHLFFVDKNKPLAAQILTMIVEHPKAEAVYKEEALKALEKFELDEALENMSLDEIVSAILISK